MAYGKYNTWRRGGGNSMGVNNNSSNVNNSNNNSGSRVFSRQRRYNGGIKYVRYITGNGEKVYLNSFDELKNYTGMVEIGFMFGEGSLIMVGLLDKGVFLPKSMITSATPNNTTNATNTTNIINTNTPSPQK